MMKKLTICLSLALIHFSLYAQIVEIVYDSSITSNMVKTDFEIDSQDNLWVGYSWSGLGIYNGTGWEYINTSNSPLISDNINDIFIFNDTIFIATDDGISIKYPGYWESFTDTNGLPAPLVNSVYYDGTNLFAIVNGTSFAAYDGSTWTTISLPAGFLGGSAKPVIYKTSNGNIYIGNKYLYRLSGTNLIQLSPGNTDTLYLIRSVVEDNDHRLWVACHSGMHIIANDTIKSYEELYPIPLSKPKNIQMLTRTDNGKIIFSPGFWGTGVCFYMICNADSQKLYGGIELGAVLTLDGLRTDHQNRLWYAAPKECLYRLDFSNYENFGDFLTLDNTGYLDINKVKAGYMNRGTFFWDRIGSASYEVPKGSGKTSLFSTGLWVGGIDPQGEMRVAANRYQDAYMLYLYTNDSSFHGNDFFPGPIDTVNFTCDTSLAHQYDKIWKVDCRMINEFITNFNNGNVASGSYHIPDNILTWPAHGSGNTSHKLSPFIDINHDGLYNPYNGDYPELKGDQMLYWIFNDCLSNHGNTGSKKMGLEIHATAYAYNYENSPTDSIDLVNYQTFLDFMIINRSDTVYNDVYAGIWSDGDLGDPYDDYIGSHVKSNSFYFYNDEFDGNGQTYSYGEHPPVQTITFLKGPLATIDGIDNDHDLVLDEYDEEMLLSKFIHFNNLGFYNPTGDPLYYNDYYNLLRGHWKDSTSLTYDSTGYGGTVEADFAFPGSSDPYGWGTEYTYMPPWSELTVGNTPDDRRGVGSLGPCSLLPGDTIQFTIMFGWFRDTSVSELGIEPFENDIEIVRNWYYHNTFPSDCDVINSIHSPEPEHGNLIVYPNPATDKISISGIPKAEPVTIEIFDVTGQLVKTSSRHVNISVKELEKGLYIIKMYNSDSLGGREVKLIKI